MPLRASFNMHASPNAMRCRCSCLVMRAINARLCDLANASALAVASGGIETKDGTLI
jgi:hypothetical protein